jgi:hypothetical protein
MMKMKVLVMEVKKIKKSSKKQISFIIVAARVEVQVQVVVAILALEVWKRKLIKMTQL